MSENIGSNEKVPGIEEGEPSVIPSQIIGGACRQVVRD
jgi:hypothetical protein